MPDPGYEVTEADLAEQQTPVRPDDEGAAGVPAPDTDTTVEADEGDLAEQALVVPLDEDEDR